MVPTVYKKLSKLKKIHSPVWWTSHRTATYKKKLNINSYALLVSDLRGGFELHSAAMVEKQSHLVDKLEKLSLSGPRACRQRRRRPTAAFTPLLDIPVDGYRFTEEHQHMPAGIPDPNWLLADYPDVGRVNPVRFEDVSGSARLNGRHSPQEYELQTVSISKTKQSLGECLS